MNYLERFKVPPSTKVKLKDIDPGFKGHYEGHKDAAEENEHYRKRLSDLQDMLYAEKRCSLLICLPAMDTGGKDGTINHLLGTMNANGCRVIAFREPSPEELDHDFLWRIHRAVPARGELAIFNRSHYEDVLVSRVHKLITKEICSVRYDPHSSTVSLRTGPPS